MNSRFFSSAAQASISSAKRARSAGVRLAAASTRGKNARSTTGSVPAPFPENSSRRMRARKNWRAALKRSLYALVRASSPRSA